MKSDRANKLRIESGYLPKNLVDASHSGAQIREY